MTASTVPELLEWLRNRSRSAKIVLVPRRVDEPAITTAGVLDDALVALAATGGAPPAVPDQPPEGVLDDLHADLIDIAERLRTGRDVGPTRLIRAVGLAAQALEPPTVTCTGIAARWCPLCGACTCEPGSDTDFEEPTCPVHGGTSPHPHAANPPPDIGDLLQKRLREALEAEGLEGEALEAAVTELNAVTDREARRIRQASARRQVADGTIEQHGPHAPPLAVRPSDVHGRGVFACQAFAAGDIIEVSPVLRVPAAQIGSLDATDLYDHYFAIGDGDGAIALGFTSLVNHSEEPNATYRVDDATGTVTLTADRAIEPGDEILVAYRLVWFGPDGHRLPPTGDENDLEAPKEPT